MLALPAPRKKHPVDAFQPGDQVVFRHGDYSRIGCVTHRWICHPVIIKADPAVLFDVTCSDFRTIPFFAKELAHTKQRPGIWIVIDGPHSNRIVLGQCYFLEHLRRNDSWSGHLVEAVEMTRKGYKCRLHLSEAEWLPPREMLRVRTFSADKLSDR